MKILSIKEKEFSPGMIEVTTDHKDRPVFVYVNDRFRDLKSLEKEILSSIGAESQRLQKKKDKFDSLKSDFDKKIDEGKL